jgi:uncharacterized phosphatase
MKLYFLRHGESQANVDNVYAGQSDSPLTERGRKQTQKAAEAAKELGINKIYSSDISRAYDTACIVADALGIDRDEIVKDKRLREVGLGKLVGKPHSSDPGKGYRHYAYLGNDMDVEPLDEVVARVKDFVDDLKHAQYHAILIVGHNGPGFVLRSLISNEPLESVGTEEKATEGLPHDQIIELEPALMADQKKEQANE